MKLTLPSMVSIEGGEFQMGSTPDEILYYLDVFAYAFRSWGRDNAARWLQKQTPKGPRHVDTFELARHLVTNAEYQTFEDAVLRRVVKANPALPDHPVMHVGFLEALAYCQWLSQCSGDSYRLPTEEEWEFAASSRGTTKFPWGNKFGRGRANTLEEGIGGTTPVGAFPSGASAQGLLDLGGNVEEWTSSLYLPYPGGIYIADHLTEESGDFYPVARGGSYALNGDLCLASRRHGYKANLSIIGFRVARTGLHPQP